MSLIPSSLFKEMIIAVISESHVSIEKVLLSLELQHMDKTFVNKDACSFTSLK